ncbi:DUF5684 domain-containing protein [Mediannikoviicoccus vaginalis]|uniref:DUF5684 domain-containing protein n=1 Tax=Mediannikoviicoccus vaginalis TaxID=2899727 RepID=UPI001F41D578|nr:DUF5684 domain-containing protein [Mediannikoviicoccus vaginalis]
MDNFKELTSSAGGTLSIVCSVVVAIVLVIGMWKMFTKAGEPGWAAIIPLYNLYVLFKITWGSGMKFLLLLIPIVNIIILIKTQIKLAKSFGKGGGFVAGLILLTPIFYAILGFGDAKYMGVPVITTNYNKKNFSL